MAVAVGYSRTDWDGLKLGDWFLIFLIVDY